MPVVTDAPTAPPLAPLRPAGRIGAVDGLRGLALLLVVAFHLFGDGRVSGGVDVFLLLSGYFATSTLLRRAETGTLRLAAHYARTLTRLLPAALVVLAAVTIALFALAPRLRWSAVLREVGASATFWENWELVRSALTYGAAGPDTSPLQHFWSLSVQGQFFAVWPLVVLALVAVARSRSRTGRPGSPDPALLLAVVAGVGTAASFAGAVWLVTVDQQVAYFSTFTRFWEIGAGVLLALAHQSGTGRAAAVRSGTWWRCALGWAGLAMVVGSGFLIDGAIEFPGAPALLPVAGAALILTATRPVPPPAGGTQRAKGAGVERLLDSPVLRLGARISYALYLWHWPVLVFWLLATESDRPGPAAAAAVLAVSTALAWLTTRYVSEPLLDRATSRAATRSSRGPLVALAGTAVLMLCCTSAGAAAHDAAVRGDVVDLLATSPEHPGAAALGPDAPLSPPEPTAPFRPSTWVAAEDHPDRPGCVQSSDGSELLECTLVAPSDPTAVVYLAGASHTLQYEEAFVALAQKHGWELREMLKHGCRLATSADESVQHPPSCPVWSTQALDALVAARPDAVVEVGTRTYEDGSAEQVLPGQVGAWRVLDDVGITVVTIRDNPRFEWFVPECLASSGTSESCGRARADQLADESPLSTAREVPASAVHLDLTDSICGPEQCQAVVGNVLVYRDDDHLTNTYVRTLAPAIDRQLRSGAPSLFDDAPPPG